MESLNLVLDIREGVNSGNPRDLTNVGNKLFFTAATDGSADENRELWITDGTALGTKIVRDINPGDPASNPGWLTRLGSDLYFVADDGDHGNELWVTDGTSANTRMVGDIQSGEDGSEPKSLFSYGGKLYFSAEKSQDRELWRYDPLHDNLELFYNINNPLVRRLSNQLVDRESGYPQDFARINDELWFTADDGVHGRELWKTDGTKEGTDMVADLTKKSSNSAISNLVEMGNYAFFVASSDNARREVFRSDGTADGTVILKDIAIGSSSNPEDLTVCNGHLFFSADASHLQTGRELYISDGTISGTSMLKDINPNGTSLINHITKVGNSVFFVATAGESGGNTGVELWRTDGTTDGTVLVKDIAPGRDSSLPQDLVDASGVLYLKADDDVHGFELWRSDGTNQGTSMVTDLYENAADGEPEYLTFANVGSDNDYQANSPYLFFAGYQRKDQISTGNELWKLSLAQGDGLADTVTPVADHPSGFTIDASKPQISFPAATEIALDSWRIYVDEGSSDVAPVIADEPVTWGLVPEADSQRFELDEVTGELSFSKTPDFDDPYDSDADNIYSFDLTALDSAGNESTAAVEVRVNPINNGEIMLLTNGSKKSYKGTSGADTFLFNNKVSYGRKQAPRIRDFDSSLGDQILFGGRALGNVSSIDQLDFKTVRSKKRLKKVSQKGFDLIYFQPKGMLYYDQNSESKGFGQGGLIAILSDAPKLNQDCFGEWIG